MKIDINERSFKDQFNNYMIYNPHNGEKIIEYKTDESKDLMLYDCITGEVIVDKANGKTNIKIPGKSSRIIVELPANSKIEESNGILTVDGQFVDVSKSDD